VEEVEGRYGLLKGGHNEDPVEDLARHQILQGSHTDAKRRKDKNVMVTVGPLQIEGILQHSKTPLPGVVRLDTLQVLVDPQLSVGSQSIDMHF
jgi:hypothetical protein